MQPSDSQSNNNELISQHIVIPMQPSFLWKKNVKQGGKQTGEMSEYSGNQSIRGDIGHILIQLT